MLLAYHTVCACANACNTWTSVVQSLPNAFNAGTGWLFRRMQPTPCSAAEHCPVSQNPCFGSRGVTFFFYPWWAHPMGELLRLEPTSAPSSPSAVFFLPIFSTIEVEAGLLQLWVAFSWAVQTGVVLLYILGSCFFVKVGPILTCEQSLCIEVTATFS